MYQLTNRFTKEVKIFKDWSALDKASLDIRTWGRAVEIKPVKPIAVLAKVYINPMLWSKDVPVWRDTNLEKIYPVVDGFSYMAPIQRSV